MKSLPCFLLFFAFTSLPVSGFSSAEGARMQEKIEIEEKLGQRIPLDASFRDETGKEVLLGEVMGKPTIVSLVYLSCTHVCPTLLGGLAEALGALGVTPGKDYTLITLSFDDRDTPENARDKKNNYLKAIGEPVPQASWRFLTGNEENIRRLTETVGFHFRKENNGFSHPRAVIFLSSGGKVVRYLYGPAFTPFDIKLALAEASREERGLNTARLLLFSYGYDRQERRYTFNLLKVSGLVLFFSMTSLVVFVLFIRKKTLRGKI